MAKPLDEIHVPPRNLKLGKRRGNVPERLNEVEEQTPSEVLQVEQGETQPGQTAFERARLLERMMENDRTEAVADLFLQLHPFDRAEVMTELRGGMRRYLAREMAAETVAGLLEHMEPRLTAPMLRNYSPRELAEVLDLADPGAAAEVLELLEGERRLETIGAMSASVPVETLLRYEDGTAGRLIDPEIPAFLENTTVPIALDRLRLMGEAAEEVNSLPVIDGEGILVGTVKPVRLALARPNSTVADIMDRDLTTVPAWADEELALRLISRFKVSDLPVVENDGRLAGLIRAEDAVEAVQENATEDMFRMASIGEERITGPLTDSVRSRFPWLALNLVTVFIAAVVIGMFESTIAKVVALAAFLPIVAGQGGIGGTQTVTLVVRSLATGELPRPLGFRLLRREITLGLIHGIVLGVIIGGIGWLWKGNPILGLVLALAMTGNMVVASIAGAGVPLLLRRLRMDPAVSAAVFVTTFTDVIGFALFLGLAAVFIRFLV